MISKMIHYLMLGSPLMRRLKLDCQMAHIDSAIRLDRQMPRALSICLKGKAALRSMRMSSLSNLQGLDLILNSDFLGVNLSNLFTTALTTFVCIPGKKGESIVLKTLEFWRKSRCSFGSYGMNRQGRHNMEL